MSSIKSYINIANKYDRVVVLVDMDCFYCQVEEKLDPSLKGKPIAVVQYNAWRGGGIIAVNYPAREQGVTRHMRGDEAKEQCPDIVLARVPSVREKADLTKYREAGKDVATILQKFTPLLERASIDEAYLDITEEVVRRLQVMNQGDFKLKPSELENTFAVGYEDIGQYVQEISNNIETDTDDFNCEDDDLPAVKKSAIKLLIGAAITNEIRAAVKEKTGFDCSAGIAHNKILAKLACGINKPNKQTILPLSQIQPLFSTLPVAKIKGLGGKFGEDLCEMLSVKYLGDLLKFSEADLQKRFDEKNGSWLYLIVRGIDLECVTPRFYSKSIGCCKKFPGRNAITGTPTLEYWLGELANEISERMEKDIIENNRKAKQMVVSYIQEIGGQDVSSSRSTPLPSYDPEQIAKCAFDILRKNTDVFIKHGSDKVLNNPLKFLGVSVGKFETLGTNQNSIAKLFLNHKKKESLVVSEQQASSSDIQDEIVSEQKSEKKSFFAKFMKKPADQDGQSLSNEKIESRDRIQSCDEGKSCPTESKSFFLSVMKKKSSEPAIKCTMNTDLTTDAIKNVSSEIIDASDVLTSKDPQSLNEANIKAGPSPPSLGAQNANLLSTEPSRHFSTEPSTSTNYTHTYAEFLAPSPKETDLIICEKCNKTVLSYNIETHYDFHYAFELSQQQREEFRSEVKSKASQTPPNKKLKLSNSQTSNSKKNSLALQAGGLSIEKFLSKEVPSTATTSSSQEMEKCMECQNLVQVDKMLEHLDYHAAKKAQVDWNKELIQKELKEKAVRSQMFVALRSSSAKSGGGRKMASAKTKNIKTFFTSQS